jgi:hypothetical protein
MLYYVISEMVSAVVFTVLTTSEDQAYEWAEEMEAINDDFSDVRSARPSFSARHGDEVAVLVCDNEDDIAVFSNVAEAARVAKEDGITDPLIRTIRVGEKSTIHAEFR